VAFSTFNIESGIVDKRPSLKKARDDAGKENEVS